MLTSAPPLIATEDWQSCVRIQMADSQFRNLTGAASDRVGIAGYARAALKTGPIPSLVSSCFSKNAWSFAKVPTWLDNAITGTSRTEI